MKAKSPTLLLALASFFVSFSSLAQLPVIASLAQNGQLVCSNLLPNAPALVEWASSPAGPWSNSWAGLSAVIANSNGVMSARVPMFFRVRGILPATNGMALVPAGSFTMGNSIGDSDIPDADPVTTYCSGFYMDVNLVTYDLWQSVYTVATNLFGYTFSSPGTGVGTNYPVTGLTWPDAMTWCNARSQLAGLTPVYYSDAGLTRVITNYQASNCYANWSANGYRLPTEAEWEKAARGGLIGQRFPWGDTISESQANYNGDTTTYSYDLGPNGLNPLGSGTGNFTPVGSFPLNGYGLSDMAGNGFQ